ncbi:MAG: VWA domain-containing protein [Planctomycetes bacterium]|nr:VWA domain-containing protein [Planctomycetota bacterium]MBI3844441.1 VWA domain-containing protein [Planctomycetota bacterium]
MSSRSRIRRCAIVLVLLAAAVLPGDAGCTGLGRRPGDRIFLVDVSASIDPSPEGALAHGVAIAREGLAGLESGSRVGLVVFAGDAASAFAPGSASRLADPVALPSALGGRPGTDVERGIRAAIDLLGDRAAGSDIVLIGDGRESRGDARRAARDAARLGIRIHTVFEPDAPRHEPSIRALEGPSVARPNAPIELDARVSAPDDRATTVRVEVTGGDEPASIDVTIAAGDERSVPLVVRAPQPGFHVFEATVRESRTGTAPARATHGVLVVGPPNALLMSSRDGGAVKRALDAAGFDVTVRRGDATSASLADVDLVVFHDLPHRLVGSETESAIVAWVKDAGGGLVVLGGREAFGPGGWRGTPLEELWPLRCGPESPGPTRLVLLVDRSGSMADLGKGALVSEAAEACLRSLGPRDLLALAFFAGETHWIVKDFVERDAAAGSVRDAVRAFAPNGETDLFAAVSLARRRFDEGGATNGPRYLLIVSDGRAKGDFARLGDDLATSRVRTSVIATGDDVDEVPLRALTQNGANGRFDRIRPGTSNPSTIADLVERDLAPDDVREREAQVVERAAAPWLTPLGALPPVQGWVRTHAPPRATVHLALEDGDPLLASWRVGRGTAVAFASDPESRWASAYGASPSFVADLARHAAREAAADSDVWFEFDAAEREVRLVAGARSRDATPATLRGIVAGLDGALVLEPCGLGVWRAPLPAWPPGSYLVSVRGAERERFRVPFDVAPHMEESSGPVDRALLEEVASITGGVASDVPPKERPLGSSAPGLGAARDVLIGAAIVLVLLDLVAGRVPFRLKPRAAIGR